MEVAETTLIVFGLLMAAYGVAALVAVWVCRGWLRSPLFGRVALLGRAEPTPINQTFMAAWALVFGARLAASVAEIRLLSTALLFVLIVLTAAVLSVQFGGAQVSPNNSSKPTPLRGAA